MSSSATQNIKTVRPVPQWSSSALVLEVPVEAGEGPVLLALVLEKQGALVHAKLLQISAKIKQERFEFATSTFAIDLKEVT